MDTNKEHPRFGLEFPLSQSFVMSALVQPFLPAMTPEQASQLQMKKTSWKSIRKFIKALDKQKILKSKDRDGNEIVVQDIDFNDEAIVSFKPYKLPKKDLAEGTGSGRAEKSMAPATGSDDTLGQELKVISLYKPKDHLSPIFERTEGSSKSIRTAADIRSIVTSYVEGEGLISETNKRLVKLNPFLANAVFSGDSPLDREVLAKGSVPREVLIEHVISQCAAYHNIVRTSGPESSSDKPKAGLPPKIHIQLETRSGNKAVTKVSGVEAYFISPQPLADELRKICACSTSVERQAGSSPKSPVMEILLQGTQEGAVAKALERRGVKSQWVEVVNKLKGKRK